MVKLGSIAYITLLFSLLGISELNLPARISLIIFGILVLLWLLEPIPQGIVSLLGLASFMCLFPNDINTVTSGFSSPILFFVLGSTILGQAIISSGLANRIVIFILKLARYSPKKIVLQLILFLPLTPLLLPSATSRNAVLVPMYESILQQMRVPKDAPLSKMTMLILGILNPIVSSAFLTGGTAPVIAASMLGPFSWWKWFALLTLPCCLIFFLGALYLWLRYPIRDDQVVNSIESKEMAPPAFTKNQLIMLVVIVCVTLLWATDKWHHLHPAVPVILGSVAALIMPGLIKWDEIKHTGLWSTFVTLGLLMSFINIMEKTSILDSLTKLLSTTLPQNTNNVIFGLFVIGISVLLHLLIPSIPACLAFTLTIVIHWSEQIGLQPLSFGLMAMLTIDAATLYPTQNTTNMIASESNRTRPNDIFQLGLALIVIVSIVSIAVGIPLWSFINV